MTISGPRPVDVPSADARSRALRSIDDAEAYVASICFKTGPPTLLGAELEWLVHSADDPARPLDPTLLRRALGDHAPPTLHPDSPHLPLPGGATVTVEPGGQVEISSPPLPSLAALYAAVETGAAQLIERLARVGLTLSHTGIDAFRRPVRLLHTPRYNAMAAAFDRDGRHGRVMMCSTAGLQVCIDAGEPHRLAARWAALHALGPVLLAAFANSSRHAGIRTGWASTRMRAWLGMRPERTAPVDGHGDPAAAWVRYVMRAPVLCLRRADGPWHAPPDLTFANWITGRHPRPPTVDDLELHLSTLFPPIRPRGYVEVRHLDAQPPGEWLAPVAVLSAILASDSAVDSARDLCAAADGRWTEAARRGLAAPGLAAAARRVLDLACRSLSKTDLAPADRDRVATIVDRRLAAGRTDDEERR